MMATDRSSGLLFGAIIVVGLAASTVQGQGALERLEQRLRAESESADRSPSAVEGELPEPVPPLREAVPADTGDRPSLGISVIDVTSELQTRYGLAVPRGALISQIREGTAAAKYGLPLGAAIVSVDGRRISSAQDLVETIETYRPGDEVEIAYLEGDRMGRKKIRLGRRVAVAIPAVPGPADPRAANPPPQMEQPPFEASRSGETRPLPRLLDGLLDRLVPPDSPLDHSLPPIADAERAPALPEPRASAPADELTLLRQQIQTLQQQLERLQLRMDDLERRLPATEPVLNPAAPADQEGSVYQLPAPANNR